MSQTQQFPKKIIKPASYIKTFIFFKGKSMSLKTRLFSSIKNLKLKIMIRFQMNWMNLSYKGKILKDETSLYDNNILNYSTLKIIV